MTHSPATSATHPPAAAAASPSHSQPQTGGSLFAPFWNLLHYINAHIVSLNSSKFFAGMIMILINIGGKFLPIQFSKSTEEYLKNTVSKQLLVFGMAWLGTRDIYAALAISFIFIIISDYLLNEESGLCIIPPKYRILHTLEAPGAPAEGFVSDTDIANAVAVLDRAKREKERAAQRDAYMSSFGGMNSGALWG